MKIAANYYKLLIKVVVKEPHPNQLVQISKLIMPQ